MDYKELVVKSFRLAWKYKWLWVFGVFVGGGSGGGFGGNFNYNTGSPPWKGRRGGPHMDAFLRDAGTWVDNHLALIIALVVAVIMFFLVLLILSVISEGALIGAADRLDKDEPADFWESFKIGIANFWSIFGFGLLVFLIIAAPLLLIGVVVAASYAVIGPFALFGLLLFIPILLLLIPAALAIGVIHALGLRFIVIEGRGAVAALSDGWALLRQRLGPAFLTWLIGVGLALGFGIAVVLALLILLVPTAIGGFLVFRAGFTLVKLGVFVFIGLAILAALIVAQGAFGAYRSIYWTLAFRQLRSLE